jgi:hypothetical protein
LLATLVMIDCQPNYKLYPAMLMWVAR